MDIRQYEIYIDGRRLPSWFLRDADTQMGVASYFRFDGTVERFETNRDDGGSVHPEDVYDLWQPVFAQLDGHILCFRLRPSTGAYEDDYVVMRLGSEGNLHWQVQGEGNEVMQLATDEFVIWWKLESEETYVIYVDYFDAKTQMTVQVRSCRMPLRDRSRAMLNR